MDISGGHNDAKAIFCALQLFLRCSCFCVAVCVSLLCIAVCGGSVLRKVCGRGKVQVQGGVGSGKDDGETGDHDDMEAV